MGNLVNKIKRNTNKIIHNQIMNAPDFEASAAHVTGGRVSRKKLSKVLNTKIKFRRREKHCD